MIGQQFIHSGAAELNGTLLTARQLVLTGGSLTRSNGNGSISTTLDLDLQAGTIAVPVSSNGGLLKSTTGRVQLNSQLTYSGNTTLDNGTLVVASNEALPGDNTLVLRAAATLSIANASQRLNRIDESGTIALDRGSLQLNTLSDMTLAGAITGTGTFTKSGNAILSLTGPGTFVGDTTIAAGQLVAAAANVLSDSSPITVSANSTLVINGTSETVPSIINRGTFDTLQQAGTALNVTQSFQNIGTFRGGVASLAIGAALANSGSMDLRGSRVTANNVQLLSGSLIDSTAVRI